MVKRADGGWRTMASERMVGQPAVKQVDSGRPMMASKCTVDSV